MEPYYNYFYVETFYLNFTLKCGALVFQLKVYYKVDRLLTGLTAQQKGTTAQLSMVHLYILKYVPSTVLFVNDAVDQEVWSTICHLHYIMIYGFIYPSESMLHLYTTKNWMFMHSVINIYVNIYIIVSWIHYPVLPFLNIDNVLSKIEFFFAEMLLLLKYIFSKNNVFKFYNWPNDPYY